MLKKSLLTKQAEVQNITEPRMTTSMLLQEETMSI